MQAPTFEQVWADLRSRIAPERDITTLTQHGANHLQWMEGEGIRVVTAHGADKLPQSMFAQAWDTLAKDGLLTADQIPRPATFRSTALMSIFALLPYVDYATSQKTKKTTLFLADHIFSPIELSSVFGVGSEGGIRYSGTSVSPNLVLFITDPTKTTTHDNPYTDHWVDDIFNYCGAGLDGDQVLRTSNQAMHASTSQDFPVYGFQKKARNQFAYMGRFKVVSVDEEQQSDRNGALRKVFIFRMRRTGPVPSIVGDLQTTNNTGSAVLPLPTPRPDLAAICQQFSEVLRASHISFGPGHDEVVRSFVASLATKRFVILTGLSGSGKTQIALRFGDWLGQDRCLLVPVRPDWTGAEALFGYEDALLPAAGDGRRAWHVPDILAFMLRAAANPEHPYMLILDEMNLAHVERYFADVLSGMESGQPCLPNLQASEGVWRVPQGAPARIPFPTNLFVVGTVNVDETTYMFSPKVLDRANTFEFRVGSEDLSPTARKPIPCAPGDPGLVLGFLAIAQDEQWHETHPPGNPQAFAEHLRALHHVLQADGFEFGHRVFFEAIRFAALFAATGAADPLQALDLQVMQKVLPRLHGTRRRLEPTLAALGRFCFDPTAAASAEPSPHVEAFDPLLAPPERARLSLSFDKLRRMLRNLRANQFASFTE